MIRLTLIITLLGIATLGTGQKSRFELSGGTETATYAEIIEWYQQLAVQSPKIRIREIGPTDAGLPLHLVVIGETRNAGSNQRIKILINNGIHPGEPDGIDACMLLARDIANGSFILPANVQLNIIPVYNIGGCLNRSGTSRVNQNGPSEYGFRGNSQNLDLNRDFTKCDSREAQTFNRLFQQLQPDILIDNHVSDGADYPYTMTLLTTQYNKLGDSLGHWLKQQFEPAIYQSMEQKGESMTPYVNFEDYEPSRGMEMFYDPPRFSSGYAALFQTIAFVPETHMLKPFKSRVQATRILMETIIEQSHQYASSIRSYRQLARKQLEDATSWPLNWRVDSSKFSLLSFKGYLRDTVVSEVTQLPRMQYNHHKPFQSTIRFFNEFIPDKQVPVPDYYYIPQCWYAVTDRLQWNGVQMTRLKKDTLIELSVSRISNWKSLTRPYEKHFRHYAVQTTQQKEQILLHAGDWVINTRQPARRYLIEMLEPTGDDSFFSWNFFDGILQQKEWYSDYRWEEVAAQWLQTHPELREALETKKKNDPEFAKDASAQLQFVYKHSPYYESTHLRYPVYRKFSTQP